MYEKTQTPVNVRMFDIKAAAAYIGLGNTSTRTLMKQIGAEKHIGKRVIYDKKIIDKYLDELSSESMLMEAAQ